MVKRRYNQFLFVFLITCALLLRSTAGLAMQIDMAYAVANAATVERATPPCHTASNGDQIDELDSESACTLCCIAAVLPSAALILNLAVQHTAPTTVLFNSLPAPAQRPAKPPLV